MSRTKLPITIRLFVAMAIAMSSSRALADDPAALPTHARSELLNDVDDAIARGVKFLLAHQNEEGSWGEREEWKVGQSALITLALLSCGESAQSPPMRKAIEWLRTAKTNRTYDIGLRACAFASVPEGLRGRVLRSDLSFLLNNVKSKRSEPDEGMYAYTSERQQRGDFSNSQYGVLGVWYSAQAGIEVPGSYWARVEAGWRRGQGPDGGWGYTQGDRDRPYASMTAAGAATLFITNDFLHAEDAKDLNVPASNAPLELAVRWLGDNFAADANAGRDIDLRPHADDPDESRAAPRRRRPGGTWIHYMLFGYERVGEASGLTRFGTHRWFNEGAKYLLDQQEMDGHFQAGHEITIDTAYALLFLSRGRSPVAIQKLQFGSRWNNRPRDAANFVRFMRQATERHTNWQIVSADAPLADLREAPILYLASDRGLELNPEQRDKLAGYVNEGGLLLFANEGTADRFSKSVQSTCKLIWPEYTWRELPTNHPVRQNNFPMTGWTAPILGLSNGVREIAILFPSGDPTWKWQSSGGATTATVSPFAPLANLLLYLTDKSKPRFKGETTWIDRDASIPEASSKITIARLRHAGNWDPEPFGWRRLSNLLHNARDAELTSRDTAIAPDELRKSDPLCHLTATGAFSLAAAEQNALKAYLDGGGFLLFDAAGGSAEATISFEALMAGLYPSLKSELLPPDHPIYAGNFPGGHKLDVFHYRRATSSNLPPTTLPRLRAFNVEGRIIAIQSNEDLSAALVGYTTGGITGYTPSSAVELMRNLLPWAASRRAH